MTADRASIHAIAPETPIYVAGHTGLVGGALLRRLRSDGFTNVLVATRDELDLRNGAAVLDWFQTNAPKLVFMAAGAGGGLLANADVPADFLLDNLAISSSVLQAARSTPSVSKLVYLSPANVYPPSARQPIVESELLSGPLEPANRSYALAKLAGIEMCRAIRRQYGRNFVAAVATNTYGPGGDTGERTSTVVPGLIRRFCEAADAGTDVVDVWGSGAARRDFLYVDDLADALLAIMNSYDRHEHINVGTGTEVTIAELAGEIARLVHPDAQIRFDTARPEGAARMCLDVSKLTSLGWAPQVPLSDGLRRTVDAYREGAVS